MKILKYVILFVSVVALLLQPYSFNSKAFQNLASTKDNNAGAKGNEDCGCSAGGQSNLSLKDYEH